MISLGLRFSLRGGREAGFRLAFTAFGVAVGVGLLLFTLSGFNGLHAKDARQGWLLTRQHNTTPSVNEATTDPLWWHMVYDTFGDRQFLFVAIAHHGGRGGHLLANVLHRMASLKLHIEVHHHAEQDDGDDDGAADRIAQGNRDGAGRQKNEDEGIGKKAKKGDQTGEARLPDQAVGAMETQALFRLGGGQPGGSGLQQRRPVRHPGTWH